MTPFEAVALFTVMLGLAALPSTSVALVVIHSASVGIRAGLAVSAGIVAGDLLFATLAILGIAALAETLGAFFVLLRVGAAAYLLWLGIGLLRRAADRQADPALPVAKSLTGGFLAGFLLTLSDVKAILFYASLFPVFIDLRTLSSFDVALIMAVTVIAVGGVKTTYAIAARCLALTAKRSRLRRAAQLATGGLLIGAGGYLLSRP